MEIDRIWEMPNSNTFKIKAILNFILNNIEDKSVCVVDPFANEGSIGQYLYNYVSNDLDPKYHCQYNMDALDFLKTFDDASIDVVLFDPPYSPRQVSECYKSLGKTVTMEDTSSSFWTKLKTEIARIVKPNGLVFSFGWNTNGMGMSNNFKIEKIRMVAHGGMHNDTLCMMERKISIPKKINILDMLGVD